ncbi:MAG TPA: DUF1707 domain-containing protein [Acidimicrobiales bacterium]|nr:DUF1707 domain-containing protein [Acidimicrobiales bacterium]
MVDDTGGEVQPHQAASPLPIPELDEPGTTPVAPVDPRPADPQSEVTDEDRQTYGRLLDSATERGLLSPYEYETRLSDLAEASTIDEMKRIVTELPIFTASTPAKPERSSRFGGSRHPGPPDGLPLVPGSAQARMPGVSQGRSNRWTKLIILLIVVIALFVALSIYAAHLANNRNNRSGAPSAGTTLVVRPVNPAGTTTLRL